MLVDEVKRYLARSAPHFLWADSGELRAHAEALLDLTDRDDASILSLADIVSEEIAAFRLLRSEFGTEHRTDDKLQAGLVKVWLEIRKRLPDGNVGANPLFADGRVRL